MAHRSTFRAKKQRTLMLIEDSAEDRYIYQRYLKSDSEYEYLCREAETGEDALKIDPSGVDLVLLDYLLPDLDGLEWLNQWRQKYRAVNLPPVVVLTSHGDENIAVQFIKIGATDYLVKSQITATKLRLSLDRAIILNRLQQDKQDLIVRLIDQNKKLTQSNQKYQQEIAKREKLKEIVDKVPAVIYAKNVVPEQKKAEKFWLVNQEFQKIFALSETEIIGKSDRDLFPNSIAETLEANDREVIESKQHLFTEEQVLQADNKLHTYLSLKFPLFDEQQQVISIAGVATDITQQKQSQVELEKSEARFRSTFEQAAVGIAHVSVGGKWLRVNQKLCQILGYTKEELLQSTFPDLTHPEDVNTDLKFVEQILKGEIDTYSIEKRYLKKDEEIIWVNLTVSLVKNNDGTPDYFIFVIEDIRKRKTALNECQILEQSLQKSLKRLSNLHQIDKAILEAQNPQIIAQTAIGNIQKLLNCQRTTIIDFDWEQKTATILATEGEVYCSANAGRQVPLNVWQNLIVQLECDGDYTVCSLSQFPSLAAAFPSFKAKKLDRLVCFPLRAKGKLMGLLKVWVENIKTIVPDKLDILQEVCDHIAIAFQQARLYQQTQNYALELEVKVAERTAQLEEINQELKAFTYSISHDLKAPLRAIQGFATALQEDYSENLDDLGREYTWRLVSSTQQMEQLIQDLLTYSRLARTQIQLHSVDLSSVVRRAIAQQELAIERAGAEIALDEPLLSIQGNKTILSQVIGNLLSNAIKFVSPDLPPKIHIWTEIKDGRVRLWVEDNGIGIESQHQSRIFQVFERLHGNEAYTGTGIGLAIVKKGMERLGGRVGLESQSSKGSRFWIEAKPG